MGASFEEEAGGAIEGTGLHTPIRANVYPPCKDTSCRWTRLITYVLEILPSGRNVADASARVRSFFTPPHHVSRLQWSSVEPE